MNSIRKFIESQIRLVVNEDKSSVSGPMDLTFLGFHLSKSEDGGIAVAISQRTRGRMDSRIRELTPRTWGRSLNACFERLNGYLRGWVGYFRLCTEDRLTPLHKFDAHIRRRLRAIIIRQKKRPRHLYRHLRACDVSPRSAAHTAYQRTGVWRRSVSSGIHKAYPNAWFAARLTVLTDQWHLLNPKERVSVTQQRMFDC
jgi:RNA-directed DNA polymerase